SAGPNCVRMITKARPRATPMAACPASLRTAANNIAELLVRIGVNRFRERCSNAQSAVVVPCLFPSRWRGQLAPSLRSSERGKAINFVGPIEQLAVNLSAFQREKSPAAPNIIKVKGGILWVYKSTVSGGRLPHFVSG